MKLKSYTYQIIIVVFTFILYNNTLGHQYALDDKMTIWNNKFTQNGINGIRDILSYDSMAGMFGKESRDLEGGRYRPLSLITFALEVELFGKETTDVAARESFIGNPMISHLNNILLYCISLLILFTVLKKLFRNYKPKYEFLSIPFIVTMLFAAHPLHTEVVANIKGRDEILAFLFSIAALNSIINYFDKNNKLELVNSFIFIFLGAMSKEISITFLAVIPLSIYFFRDKQPLKKYAISMIPLFSGVILYLIIRNIVIGNATSIESANLMNNPFLEATKGQRYATIALTLLIYLKLLIFPHPLTWDYYPYHISIVGWSNIWVILSVLIHLGLAVVAIYGIKKKTVYSYGIIIYAATLSITSNVFFNIGAFMSERFVYVSLLGFCIIIAYLLSEKLPGLMPDIKKYCTVGITVCTIILLTYSVKTISRNKVWENNLTLFSHDIKISSNSAKGNSSYASELYKLSEDAEEAGDTITRNKYLKEALPYFEKAVEIYPAYDESLVGLGNIYYRMYGDYHKMFEYYKKTLSYYPLQADVWSNTIGVLTYNIDDPDYEKQLWLDYMELSPSRYESFFHMGNLYYFVSEPKPDSAIYYYEKAKKLNPSNFDVLYYLGINYGNTGNFENARANLLLASGIKEDAEVYRYLGISYGIENDDIKALEYFEKAYKLDPQNEQVKQNIMIARQRIASRD
ncbi:MAG: tetratricopeptide repeat protein [Bacteroidales bacterium]|jgi:tetratricopeptide (TPR) repeat protein|nr:tetratricopeptide repeat protein [Bacteroidales bacterium]